MLWFFAKCNRFIGTPIGRSALIPVYRWAGNFDSCGPAPYHAPAMANPMLDHESPEELADRGQIFEIKGKVQEFGRLVEIIEADLAGVPEDEWPANWRDAPVEIKLAFSWADDRKKVPLANGTVRTRIAALCQRCLETFELPLETEVSVVLLRSQEDKFGDLDVWAVEEETIRPIDILEESLVMALPFAAMHEPIDLCGPLIAKASEESVDVARPFADLRSQMKKLN
jgi:uncharacterized metal-binding protein YceD (DUF177 family)